MRTVFTGKTVCDLFLCEALSLARASTRSLLEVLGHGVGGGVPLVEALASLAPEVALLDHVLQDLRHDEPLIGVIVHPPLVCVCVCDAKKKRRDQWRVSDCRMLNAMN